MKLKKEYVTHNDGEQQMMVDTSAKFSGLVRNNKTAAYIVDLLKSEITEEQIVAKMLEKYNVEESVLKKDVRRILDTLRSVGAIDG